MGRAVSLLSSLAIALVACFSDPPPAVDDDTTGTPTNEDSTGSTSGNSPASSTSVGTETTAIATSNEESTDTTPDTGTTGTPDTCGNGSTEIGELCIDDEVDFEAMVDIPIFAIDLGAIDDTPGDGALVGNDGENTYTRWWLWDGGVAGPQIQGENGNIGAPAPTGVRLGDLDGDMQSDVVFGSTLQLSSLLPFNAGVTGVTCPFPPVVSSFTLAQIDDDAELEPVVASAAEPFGVTAWLAPAEQCLLDNRVFDTKTQLVAALQTNDGPDELVVSGSGTTLLVGTIADPFDFVPLFDHDVMDEALHMVVGDFDGDGLSNDLAVSTSEGIAVLLRNGDMFEQGAFLAAGGVVNAMAAADLDSDGDDDLVVADDTSSTIALLLSSGPGVLSYLAGPDTAATNTAVASADANDDLAPDIVVGGEDGRLRWFLAEP